MVQLWAILIGIDKYLHHSHLHGCVKDVENVDKYLQDDLHIPSARILKITNQDAKRTTIISTFYSHLIDNPDISSDAAILFHYSGHASFRSTDTGRELVLIPFDEGRQEDGEELCGIPGRTLGSLLNKAARKCGDNITVIMDACHGLLGERGGVESSTGLFSIRGIHHEEITAVGEDVDCRIWEDDEVDYATESTEEGLFLRAGFAESEGKCRVFLAACSEMETCFDTPDGGIFTLSLISALKDMSICPRTYSEIIRHVKRSVDKFYFDNGMTSTQTPQCRTQQPHRLVFEQVRMDPKFFPVRSLDSKTICRIDAGEIHGVTLNTRFEIHDMEEDLQSSAVKVGPAVVTEVSPTCCIAKLDNDSQLPETGYQTAVILRCAYELTYSILNTLPDSQATQDIVCHIEREIEEDLDDLAYKWERVDPGVEVDVRLEIDVQNVIFKPCDSFPVRRLRASDLKVTHILNAIARFNFYLGHQNPRHPFQDVAFEMHLLEDESHYGNDAVGSAAHQPELHSDLQPSKPKKEIPFGDEATFIQSDDHHRYAFVLRNRTSTPLYPHIIYFDPTTYAIETWYTSQQPDTPMLPPDGVLQIGQSSEYNESFMFSATKIMEPCFIKVLLLKTHVAVDFIGQPGVFDEEEIPGYPNNPDVRRTVDASTEGCWDTIKHKIIVHLYPMEEND